jgi:3-deoxy-D-manno-octulosonic acid (KDO) 8-phosphate synthase
MCRRRGILDLIDARTRKMVRIKKRQYVSPHDFFLISTAVY